MFETTIGPREGVRRDGYLRPETPQASSSLQERPAVLAKRPPFGIAQIGKSFRNEIKRQLHL